MDVVFSTTELFEAVLLELDIRNLLWAQRVCQRWKYFIAISPAIQQKLFLAPVNYRQPKPTFNALLQEIFPLFFQLRQVPSRNDWDEWLTSEDLRNLDWFQHPQRRKALLREDASWRRMFPVQPAAKIDTVDRYTDCSPPFGIQHTMDEDFCHMQTNGATMGLIYDIIVDRCIGDEWSHFFIQWHGFLAESVEAIGRGNGIILGRYEADEDRRLTFRPENRITIHEIYSFSTSLYEYHDDESEVLQVQELDEMMFTFWAKGSNMIC